MSMDRKITIHLTLDQYQAIHDLLVSLSMLGTKDIKVLADRGLEGLKLEEPETEVERALDIFSSPEDEVIRSPQDREGEALILACAEGFATWRIHDAFGNFAFRLTDKGIEHRKLSAMSTDAK